MTVKGALTQKKGGRMKNINKVFRLYFLFMFIFFLFSYWYYGTMDNNLPADTVKRFSECYGGDCMDDIADLVTPEFRQYKPKSVWVGDTWDNLRKIEYKRLRSTVIDAKIEDGKAVVLLETMIATIDGEKTQREIYYLIYKNAVWLIRGFVVSTGEINFDDADKESA